MNGAQVHLAVNHLPVVGMMIGFLVMFASFFLKNEVVKKTGLALLVFTAITVAPAYLSGEGAEEVVEGMPCISESLIHDHEESAELSLVFTAITGGVAALALFLGRKRNGELSKKTAVGAFALSLVSVAMLVNTAHLGGLIHHPEIRKDGTGAAGKGCMMQENGESGAASGMESRKAERGDDD